MWPEGHGLEGEFIVGVFKQGREVASRGRPEGKGLQRETVTTVSKEEPHGRGVGWEPRSQGRWGQGNAAGKRSCCVWWGRREMRASRQMVC